MNQATEQIAIQFANANINRNTWGDLLVNIKVYGAKGDGVADDTAAIQSAIDYAGASGAALMFPKGQYRITATLELPLSSIFMLGQGDAKIIAAAPMTSMLHKGAGAVIRSHIENLYFDGMALADNIIWIEQGNQYYLTDLNIMNFKKVGIKLRRDGAVESSAYECHIRGCKIRGCTGNPGDTLPDYGIELGHGATDNNISDCVIANTKTGILIGNPATPNTGIFGGNFMNTVHMFGYPEPNFAMLYGIEVAAAGMTGVNLYFDGIKTAGVKMYDAVQGVQIVNSRFFWRFDVTYPEKINAVGVLVGNNCTRYSIVGCTFRGDINYDIVHQGTYAGVFLGNTSVSVKIPQPEYAYKPLTIDKLTLKNLLQVVQTDNTIVEAALGIFSYDATKYATLNLGQGDKKRWQLQKNIDAETGNNTGSNFNLVAHDDAGNVLFTVMQAIRATGLVSFPNDIESRNSPGGLILRSPDGSRWKLRVDNAGAPSWTKL